MQIQFSELVDSTIRFLEESGSSPKDLIESLDAYIPDNCRHASELDEFFCQLLPHMSFFNYEILKLIILHLNGDHLGKELSAYEKQFESYCMSRISGPHPVVFSNEAQSNTQKLLVKLDAEWDGMTIGDIKRFQCKLASILQIRQEKLLIQKAQKGCVLLTFLIHKLFLQTIVDNGLTDRQVSALYDNHIISIATESMKLFENMEMVCGIDSCC